ncbi:Sensor kinase CckA [subsurface metagenome]
MFQEKEQHNGDLKESQAKRTRSEKVTASDIMVASLTHELKNGIMSILYFIQYCLNNTSKEDKRATALLGAERETKRCINIVRDLLAYLRVEKEGEEAPQEVSCAVIIDRVFKALSSRIEKEGVFIIQHYPEEIPKVWMKAGSIQLVFLNIISNALDALKKTERKEIHVDINREGQFIRVTIRDTGCGIARKNLARIFEPFFTSKPPEEGAGLGLSICESIVDRHKGMIICESKLGTGTKFKILLPSKEGKG